MRNTSGGLRKSEMPDYGKPIIRILVPVVISIICVLLLINLSCKTERSSCRQGKFDIIGRVFSETNGESSFKLFNYQTMTSNSSDNTITTESPENGNASNEAAHFLEDHKMAIQYAISFVLLLAFLTFAIFLVLYYEINFMIYIYFGMVIFFGMTFLTLILLNQVCKIFNIRLDWFTVLFFIYNVNMLGFCIFKKTDEFSSKVARKAYGLYLSILVSSFAVLFIPPGVAVISFVIIVFWDLFAVLSPCGPLKLILNLLNERERNPNAQMKTPGNISELMLFSTMLENKRYPLSRENDAGVIKTNKSKKLIPLNIDGTLDPRAERNVKKLGSGNCIFVQKDLESMAEIRPQLGMGDFIFYNLLISKFSLVDESWFFVLVCIVSIIFGLIVTLITLIVLDMALPALPIPIVLALISSAFMYFLGGLDMMSEMNGLLIFI